MSEYRESEVHAVEEANIVVGEHGADGENGADGEKRADEAVGINSAIPEDLAINLDLPGIKFNLNVSELLQEILGLKQQ